jgi:hypothetical protein
MIELAGSEVGSGSVPLNKGSQYGGQKTIRIRYTAVSVLANPEYFDDRDKKNKNKQKAPRQLSTKERYTENRFSIQ